MDAIFKYAEHGGDEIVIYVHLMPNEGLMHVYFELEYYYVELFAEIDVDDASLTIRVRRLLCQSRNIWPGMYRGEVPKINNDNGGVQWYKRHVDLFNFDSFSIGDHIKRFYGPGWTVVVPLTVPKTTVEQQDACKSCEERLGSYRCGPWGRVVGTFFADRHDAAVIIQKHFRAWRVRFAIDPNTDFGRFLERTRFEQWMREDTAN
jgi:hypothetical protein